MGLDDGRPPHAPYVPGGRRTSRSSQLPSDSMELSHRIKTPGQPPGTPSKVTSHQERAKLEWGRWKHLTICTPAQHLLPQNGAGLRPDTFPPIPQETPFDGVSPNLQTGPPWGLAEPRGHPPLDVGPRRRRGAAPRWGPPHGPPVPRN